MHRWGKVMKHLPTKETAIVIHRSAMDTAPGTGPQLTQASHTCSEADSSTRFAAGHLFWSQFSHLPAGVRIVPRLWVDKPSYFTKDT